MQRAFNLLNTKERRNIMAPAGKGGHMNNFKKAMEAVKEFLVDIVCFCIENPGFVYDMVVSGISLAISISVLLRK